MRGNIDHQYHPTRGLMQILHFNWLVIVLEWRNSPAFLSFYFQIFLQLAFANFNFAFSVRLVGRYKSNKLLDPLPSRAIRSVAHSASASPEWANDL